MHRPSGLWGSIVPFLENLALNDIFLSLRKTRGQVESLLLFRRALSSPTTCRFIPAHCPLFEAHTIVSVEQFALEFDLAPRRRIYTVGELNAAIRAALDEEFQDIWVAGEISGLKPAASGHLYFTLKERDSQVRCVAFRFRAPFLEVQAARWLAVLARAASMFTSRAASTNCKWKRWSRGSGRAATGFEQLKKKLAAEGLFAAERKRPLPRFPRRIGIVTSPARRGHRRPHPRAHAPVSGLHIRLFPARVQGEGRWRRCAAASSTSAGQSGRTC